MSGTFSLSLAPFNSKSETQVEIRNFQGIYLSPQQAKALLGTAAAKCQRLRNRLRGNKLDPRMTSGGRFI